MDNSLHSAISSLKEKYRDKIFIVAHHYQERDIIQYADLVGDSYKMAVESSKSDAEYIIVCGVRFMAETSFILKKKYQKIIIPDIHAICPMADMVDTKSAEKYIQLLNSKSSKEFIPIVYMNSYADMKSFCGKMKGSICTSSNAEKIVKYYLEANKKILFMPDYNLGINTAYKIGLNENDIISIKDLDRYNGEKMVLWNGYCHVHKKFTVNDIEALRKKYSNITIITHPECDKEVVDKSDLSGSTEFIYNYIKQSPSGSIFGIGTETTFVERLSNEFKDKTILPLTKSECPNMKKITLKALYNTLKNVENNINNKSILNNLITLNNELTEFSKAALNNMIKITNQ